MPTAKSRVTPWALCLVLIAPSVFAAPVADIPAAPPASPTVKPPTTADLPLPTTFARAEAGLALNLGQLEVIQAETVLYELQLARAKALNELQKNGYDRALDQPFNPAPPSQDNKSEVKGAVQDAAHRRLWRSPERVKDSRPCWHSATAIRLRCRWGIVSRVRSSLLNGSTSMKSWSPGRTKHWSLFPLRGNPYV